MKKILSASLIAAMVVCTANAGLTQRGTQISDVVRMMEENPEYIDTAADAIVTARANKLSGADVKKFANTAKLDTSKLTTPKLQLQKISFTSEQPEPVQQGYYNDNGHYILDTFYDLDYAIKLGGAKLCNKETMASIVRALTQQMKVDAGAAEDYYSKINNTLSASGCEFRLTAK